MCGAMDRKIHAWNVKGNYLNIGKYLLSIDHALGPLLTLSRVVLGAAREDTSQSGPRVGHLMPLYLGFLTMK